MKIVIRKDEFSRKRKQIPIKIKHNLEKTKLIPTKTKKDKKG